jgi:hypothetical protein
MKTYPSIPRNFQSIPNCYIFDKLDGSNIRVEWSKKRGFFKFGRRNGLLDDSNPILKNEVPPTFEKEAPLFERLLADQRWKTCVLFFEFWGKRSIGGLHYEGDPKFLTLLDAAPDKKGIMPPRDFLRTFTGRVVTANLITQRNWNRELIEEVRHGDLPGITFEGVVGKAGSTTHKLVRAKAKTQVWIDKVFEIHGKETGEKIVNS